MNKINFKQLSINHLGSMASYGVFIPQEQLLLWKFLNTKAGENTVDILTDYLLILQSDSTKSIGKYPMIYFDTNGKLIISERYNAIVQSAVIDYTSKHNKHTYAIHEYIYWIMVWYYGSGMFNKGRTFKSDIQEQISSVSVLYSLEQDTILEYLKTFTTGIMKELDMFNSTFEGRLHMYKIVPSFFLNLYLSKLD